MPDETLIYDEKTGKAHCLNGTAAQVWKLCNGTTTPAEMAQELAGELDRSQARAVVRLALEQLSRRNLLETAVRPLSGKARLNRREVLKGLARVAVAAAALPIIMTMASKTGRAAGDSVTPVALSCQTCVVERTGAATVVIRSNCVSFIDLNCVCPAATAPAALGTYTLDCVLT